MRFTQKVLRLCCRRCGKRIADVRTRRQAAGRSLSGLVLIRGADAPEKLVHSDTIYPLHCTNCDRTVPDRMTGTTLAELWLAALAHPARAVVELRI